MCRISGIIQPGLEPAKLKHHIEAMSSCMKHGGPDGKGAYIDDVAGIALGHRRLSFLDLSSAGQQPMCNRKKDLQIVFNGEIYNYLEIKAELQRLGYSFFTQSDTEVILAAYETWGKAAFAKLNGMFSFAIYDLDLKEVILVRDVIGIKPLYYYQHSEGLVFASEVKAFERSGQVMIEDPKWKIYFLSLGFIPEPFSTFKDVQTLKPGHYLVYQLKDQSAKVVQFEQMLFNETIFDQSLATELIHQELSKSVQRHLIADVPVGVFLSGGLDSSLLALIASKTHSNIHTLSVNFEDKSYDERSYQKEILKKLNGLHTGRLVTQQDYLDSITQIRLDIDQPSNDAINTWFISKCAKEAGLKAALSGVGGDELFGGYPSFKRIHLLKALRHFPLQLFKIGEHLNSDRLKKITFLENEGPVNDYLFLRGFYTPKVICQLIDSTEQEVKQTLSALNIPVQKSLSPQNYTSFLEQHFYMRSQLLKDTDQMSMAHGLEIRLPFLDKDFVKLTAQLHTKLKYKSAKAILSGSFKDILPERIKSREKQGFTFPLQEWQKANPNLVNFKAHPNAKVRSITIKTFAKNTHWSRLWVLSFLEKELIRTRILFLTLKTFSLMGGIERMNRVLMKAGEGTKKDLSSTFTAFSLYDGLQDIDSRYLSKANFRSFKGDFYSFFFEIIFKGNKYDQVILSHIHLAPAGLILKYLHRSKIFVVAHGVEVWKKLRFFQRMMLRRADSVLAVSNFTRDKIHQIHQIPLQQIQVFHNCLDPFIKPSFNPKKKNKVPVIFTLCRISSSELYKGYYQVIAALALLAKEHIDFKYYLGGKYEQLEYQNIINFIAKNGLEDKVELCGYISENDLPNYFNVADVFILPSKKEGFGLVFTEAIVKGIPVIAGNKDGSVDALLNGELGTLVDPDNVEEIAKAIKKLLLNPPSDMVREKRIQTALAHFDYTVYQKRLINLLKK